ADAAIDRDDKRNAAFLCRLKGRDIDSVTLGKAVRNVIFGFDAKELERTPEKHRAGRPVNIVVAPNQDLFAVSNGPLDACDRLSHSFQKERIVQVFQAWCEKGFGLFR